MRRAVVFLCAVLSIGAAAMSGLADGVGDRYHATCVFSFTILGGYSLEAIGDYDYGPLAPRETATQYKTVILRTWCNLDTYTIGVRAGGPVWMGGAPAAGITLDNFEYTGSSGPTILTQVDALWFTGTRTIQTDHAAELRLTGLTGNESPGTYTSTVIFTMLAI